MANGKCRVMIVEDDEDARLILTQILRDRYEVVCASNGIEALHKMDTCEPDLFLLDVLMPGMDGFDTCVAIRQHPRFHDAQVIFLSAVGDRESVRKMYDLGGNYFIAKPIDPPRLLRNLDTIAQPTPGPKRHSLSELEAMEAKAPRAGAGDGLRKQPAKAPPELKRFSTKPRLMLVDDDEAVRFVLSKALEDAFEVVTADDGGEAMARIFEVEPDLLILDVMMPRMNGIALCRSLREIRAFAGLPVVFLSAHGTRKVKQDAKDAGAAAFLTKPCPVERLREALSAVIEAPSFHMRVKKHTLEELTSPEKEADLRRRRQSALQSVNRDYGSLRQSLGADRGRRDPPGKVKWEG